MTPVEAMTAYAGSLGLDIVSLEWGRAEYGWRTVQVIFADGGTGYAEGSGSDAELLHLVLVGELKRLERIAA